MLSQNLYSLSPGNEDSTSDSKVKRKMNGVEVEKKKQSMVRMSQLVIMIKRKK